MLDFERTLITLLVQQPRGERFTLRRGANVRLERALEKDLSRAPKDAVVDALKLAEAFDTKLASPAVAATIRDVLRGQPRAVAIIKKQVLRPNGLDAARRFAIGQGRKLEMRAAMFGETDTAGVPLRSFLDPRAGSGVPPIRRASRNHKS